MELRNDQRRVRVSTLRLKRQAQRALEILGLGDRTLSVLLIDDRRMAALHQRWMGEDGPTDVMSFPSEERIADSPSRRDGPSILGDIVISAETAARRRPANVSGEVRRYLIHGILHLAGCHHRTKRQRQHVNRLTRTLLRRVP